MKLIHEESRRMPSLTESAGKVVSKKLAHLVSSGASQTRRRYLTYREKQRSSSRYIKPDKNIKSKKAEFENVHFLEA